MTAAYAIGSLLWIVAVSLPEGLWLVHRRPDDGGMAHTGLTGTAGRLTADP